MRPLSRPPLVSSLMRLYTFVRLSSSSPSQVRRDSLPPAFELPHEVGRAVDEPLPVLRSATLAKDVSARLRASPEDSGSTQRLDRYPK